MSKESKQSENMDAPKLTLTLGDTDEVDKVEKTETTEEIDRQEEPTPPDDSAAEEMTKKDTETETEKKPVPKKGRWKKVLLAVIILAAALVLTFGYSLWREYSRESTEGGTEITVQVPKGSSTRSVGKILKQEGVIRYETPFLVKMYFSDYRGKLRYGEFALSDTMSLDEVIRILSTQGAQKKEASFTMPEGYSIEMTAEKLEKENVMPATEFLEAVDKAAEGFLYADVLPGEDQVFYRLQGYLYPDTYFISENMTGEALVNKMLEEFLNNFDEERQKKAQEMGMTVEEVLIRASMVQKETEKEEEYPLVAGVINNRLAKGMKLQFDSTTVYAMTNGLYGVKRVTYDDLKLESPYNTYQVEGLPIGPICSPSLAAIDAVLNPAQHNYLYFQMDQEKNDGSNLFFETYQEHMAASSTTAAPKKETDTSAEKEESTEK